MPIVPIGGIYERHVVATDAEEKDVGNGRVNVGGLWAALYRAMGYEVTRQSDGSYTYSPPGREREIRPPPAPGGGPYATRDGHDFNASLAYAMLYEDAMRDYSLSLGNHSDVETEARRLFRIDRNKRVIAYEHDGTIRLARDVPKDERFKALAHEVGAMRLHRRIPDFDHLENEDLVYAEGEAVEREYLARAA